MSVEFQQFTVTSLGVVEVVRKPGSYDVGGRSEVFHEGVHWGVPRGAFGARDGHRGGGRGGSWRQNRAEVQGPLGEREDEIREGGCGGRWGDGWGATPSDSLGPGCSGVVGVAEGGID